MSTPEHVAAPLQTGEEFEAVGHRWRVTNRDGVTGKAEIVSVAGSAPLPQKMTARGWNWKRQSGGGPGGYARYKATRPT